jgi:hypothetical protein
MTPSPGTIRRNVAAISSRRAMTAWSGAGISMNYGSHPSHSGTARRAGPGIHEHGFQDNTHDHRFKLSGRRCAWIPGSLRRSAPE